MFKQILAGGGWRS